MNSRTALSEWLTRLEQRSPEAHIELGLERVRRVLDRLAPDLSGRPVVTVAGTNGKGSVVAFAEAICRCAGLRPFAYSSPHLYDFAERLRLDGRPASAEAIVAALEQVEQARGDVALTYFEHITLAGLALAAEAGADILLLEVGLGGRLDAVNVLDADVAVITSIGLDHQEWLGSTRLSVGREKAGILRPGRPLVVGEKRLPRRLQPELEASGAKLLLAGRDFNWRATRSGFNLTTPAGRLALPEPALPGSWQHANAACAVVALQQLAPRLGFDESTLTEGLASARLPGRFEKVGSGPDTWVDVAHNPAAARALAGALGPARGPSVAVFSALEGKRIDGIARALDRCFSHWIVAPLSVPRARPVQEMAEALRRRPVAGGVETVESMPDALKLARRRAGSAGRVVVFGSFHTVAEAWPLLQTPESERSWTRS